MNYLRFEKKKSCEEYVIFNKKNQVMGQIARHPTLGKVSFYPYYSPMLRDDDYWLTLHCMKELTNFIEKLTLEGHKQLSQKK